jgi:GntR family transcriptional regulator, negative regulator for fad regulon and positive regulator of fabA
MPNEFSTTWEPPLRPAELAETRLISSILNGKFPINSTLPPERDLATQLGVTRPTLREVLQRLSRDGWIEIRHGKSTRIRDYWVEGNLNVLSTIARHSEYLPEGFIPQLLQLRLIMAPTYTSMAITNQRKQVIALLDDLLEISDTSSAYADADCRLHQNLTVFSGNPIFTLIFNSFCDLYRTVAPLYFSSHITRSHSHTFYQNLHSAATKDDVAQAQMLTTLVMQESLDLWLKTTNSQGESS